MSSAQKRPQNFYILIELLQKAGFFQKAASVAFQLSTVEEGEFRIKALELCFEFFYDFFIKTISNLNLIALFCDIRVRLNLFL